MTPSELLNAMCRKHKAALTRARNAKDSRKVLAAADAALNAFENAGLWPDDWCLWQRAREDAEFDMIRGGQQ